MQPPYQSTCFKPITLPFDLRKQLRIKFVEFLKGEFMIKLGKYKHYKGNFYEVLCLAKHSETLEEMVVYKALYGENGVWVRSASMWNEMVTVQGKPVRRFEYVG